MELSFDTKELREYCEDKKASVNKYGNELTEKLHARLADIDAAQSVLELVAGNPLELEEGIYKVDLWESYSLYFRSNHTQTPTLGNGSINWPEVSRVKIMNISLNNE